MNWKLGLIPALPLLVYFAFLNHVEPNEAGLARNHITGDIWVQHAGWHSTSPWTWVARIKTNPIRVGVPTAGRGYSAKLIQFQPEYANDFLQQEGWRYYWWNNRVSFNLGNKDEYRGFKNIMLGYAYSKQKFPFIKILEEYEN